MINSNGNLISSFSEIPEDFIKNLHTHLSVLEVLRYENKTILFWELHYFRIITVLRRLRFEIPMNYTMEYLKEEVVKLMNIQLSNENSALITIQFIPYQDSIGFLMSFIKVKSFYKIEPLENYIVDLFKEGSIQSNNLSNISTTNTTLFNIAKKYAKENGFDDCVILNDQKKLAETIQGSLYLLQEEKILTPALKSGCQDFALRTAFNEWLENKQKIFKLIEQEISPFEIQKSNEIMVLSLKQGYQGVSQYRKSTYISNQLKELFNSFIQDIY